MLNGICLICPKIRGALFLNCLSLLHFFLSSTHLVKVVFSAQ